MNKNLHTVAASRKYPNWRENACVLTRPGASKLALRPLAELGRRGVSDVPAWSDCCFECFVGVNDRMSIRSGGSGSLAAALDSRQDCRHHAVATGCGERKQFAGADSRLPVESTLYQGTSAMQSDLYGFLGNLKRAGRFCRR